MVNDEYNGWTNRETWAANLYLNNDEWIYNSTLKAVENSVRCAPGEAVKQFVDSLQDEGLLPGFSDEVGSLWRIDYEQIGEGFAEE